MIMIANKNLMEWQDHRVDYNKWTKSCYFCSMYALLIYNPQITKMIGLPKDSNFNILDK